MWLTTVIVQTLQQKNAVSQMENTKHTLIVFSRTDLFEVCKVGFMASHIGDLWCEGWVLSERLDQLTQLNIRYRKYAYDDLA